MFKTIISCHLTLKGTSPSNYKRMDISYNWSELSFVVEFHQAKKTLLPTNIYEKGIWASVELGKVKWQVHLESIFSLLGIFVEVSVQLGQHLL